MEGQLERTRDAKTMASKRKGRRANGERVNGENDDKQILNNKNKLRAEASTREVETE